MKKVLISSFLLGAMALSLNSCSNEEETMKATENGKYIPITVIVKKETPQTKSILTDGGEGFLTFDWEIGDALLITDKNGNKQGDVVLENAGEGAEGKFVGRLYAMPDGEYDFNFIYLGRKVEVQKNATELTVDLTKQVDLSTAGSIDLTHLAGSDILSTSAKVKILNGKSYIDDINLARHLSFAHFEFKFPEGVNISSATEVTISDPNEKMYSNAVFKFGDTSLVKEKGTMKVTTSKNDFYMAIIPCEQIAPDFTVTVNDRTFTGKISDNSFNIEKDKFYTRNHAAVPIEMKEVITLTYDDNGLNTTSFVNPTTETSVGGIFTIQDQALAVMDYESLQGYDAFKNIFEGHSSSLYDNAIKCFKCIGWSEDPNYIQDMNTGNPLTESVLYKKDQKVTFTKNTTLHAIWTYCLTILEDFNFPESAHVSGTNTNPKVGSRFYGQPYNIENPVNLSVKDYEMVGWSYDKMDPIEAGETIDESKLITTVTFQKPELYKTVYIVWRKVGKDTDPNTTAKVGIDQTVNTEYGN